MRRETWCEPKYRNGYWLLEIIDEFIPNWFQRVVLRKKPWTYTHQYTNISSQKYRPSALGWRHQPSGEKVGAGAFETIHYRMSDFVEKHLQRKVLEDLQEQEIQKGLRK